jgi:hypothetical protein
MHLGKFFYKPLRLQHVPAFLALKWPQWLGCKFCYGFKVFGILSSNTLLLMGCQMVYFHTKNTTLGIFWSELQWKMLIYFMAIWYMYIMLIWYILCTREMVILRSFGIFFHRFGTFHKEKSGNPDRPFHFCGNTGKLLWVPGSAVINWFHSLSRQDAAFNEFSVRLHGGVARFLLVQHTKTGENVPNGHEIYQIAPKYTKWPQNRPNRHIIYKHLPLQYPPKFTQVEIFGLKMGHLATLLRGPNGFCTQKLPSSWKMVALLLRLLINIHGLRHVWRLLRVGFEKNKR